MNLLIILGTVAACLYAASFLRAPQPAPDLEVNPLSDPKKSIIPTKSPASVAPIELRVRHISVSGQHIKLEVINNMDSAICCIKGHLIFTDKKGKPVNDHLQTRSFQPFSAYTTSGLVAPLSRKTITLETTIPRGCKQVRAELKQAAHADGTLKQFSVANT